VTPAAGLESLAQWPGVQSGFSQEKIILYLPVPSLALADKLLYHPERLDLELQVLNHVLLEHDLGIDHPPDQLRLLVIAQVFPDLLHEQILGLHTSLMHSVSVHHLCHFLSVVRLSEPIPAIITGMQMPLHDFQTVCHSLEFSEFQERTPGFCELIPREIIFLR
jgi:hypothetical protein